MSKNLDRLYAPTVLPYKQGSFTVDEAALQTLLRYFVSSRFSEQGGIIINSEAGEVFYLSREEKRRNVEIAVKECRNKVPLFAGVIGNTTEEAVQVAIDAKEAGVDGIFIMPPVGAVDVTIAWDAEKYPEVWIDMAKAIDKSVDLPMIAHPVGGGWVAGRGLPPSATMKMVNEIPNIVGWKMTYSYEGFKIIAKALRSLDRHVGILPSGGRYFHEALALNMFDGTVSGSWNYAMEAMLAHIEAWQRFDIEEANRIWGSGLSALHDYIYAETTRLHIRYKTAAWLRGLVPHPLMRPPLPRPRKEEISTLKSLLTKAGIKVIDESKIQRTFEGFEDPQIELLA
ncbi:MAG: dihydrodipicolinate synthase family protein [Nitrososphaerales archaeon]